MHSLHEIYLLIKNTNLWTAAENGFELSQLDASVIKLTTPELEQVDARLPTYIKWGCAREKNDGYSLGLPGYEVDVTLDLWANENLRIEEITGTSFIVKRINDYVIAKDADNVAFNLTAIKIEPDSPLGIPYACRYSNRIYHVAKKWLDTEYPAWENRLSICESLDISPEDQAKIIFQKQVSVTNDINMEF